MATATEVRLKIEHANLAIRGFSDAIRRSTWSLELFNRAVRFAFRRRPVTDDMHQMLDDLGVEPGAFQARDFQHIEFSDGH